MSKETGICATTNKPCAYGPPSLSEVSGGFQVQENCPDCGTGKGYSVTRDVGLDMLEKKEAAERAAAKLRAEKEAAEKAAQTEAKEKPKK